MGRAWLWTLGHLHRNRFDTLRYTPLSRPLRLACISATLVAALAGCGSGTEVPPAASLSRTAGDQQEGTINTALSLPLAVRARGTDGSPITGVTVTWTVTSGNGSVTPATSITDAEGTATTVWTLGPIPGQQSVTATIEGGVTTIFTATASSAPMCGATVELSHGEICLASPSRAADVQVSGSVGAEFVAIPYYDGNLARNSVTVNAIAMGATPALGPPTPVMVPFQSASLDADAMVLSRDVSFERGLRRRERESLPRLVSEGGGAAATSRSGASMAVAPAEPRFAVVGDVMSLNVRSDSACAQPSLRQGEVKKISTRAIWVEDRANAPGGFTDAEYDQIAAEFDSHIWPTDIAAFGTHTDIDNNQKVIVFFTSAVNALTPGVAPTSFVGGFFHSRDLFPKAAVMRTASGKDLQACPGSNFAEMFYMLAPDETRDFSKKERVLQFTHGTLAHELQHLINSARRLHITPNAVYPEVVWMEEGLSHIAEELSYYRVSGFQPRQNLNVDDVRGSGALIDILNRYMASNLSRLSSYMSSSSTQSPYGESQPGGNTDDWDDLATRGAIWSFMRWAADHRGSSDGDVWNRLVRDATAVGIENLRNVFGADIGGRFREWAGANYVDDAPGLDGPGAPQQSITFRHPSWNFRSILPALSSNNAQFPLQRFSIAGQTATFTLVDGGAAYLRFGTGAGTSTNLRITTSSGGQLPSGASVWIVRTK